MLSCFGDVVDSAIGIEAHNRNEIGYKPDPSLNNMYVLVSAFRDGGLITPVKLEIKEFNDKANSLYVAIALESFPADKVTEKKSRIVTEGTTNNGVAQTIPPLTIKLADLFANVNPNDESFLKYVLKQFLSDNHVKSDEYVLKSSRTNPDTALNRLEKQNERLQEEMDYLRQLVKIQKTGNRDNVLDRNSVRKQAEKLMASANAKGNVDEISGLLNDFYHRMGTDAEITWDTMQEGAGEIADWLLEHHKPEMDEYAQSVLDFLKKRRVRLNESQIGDIEYSYGYHAAGIFAAAEGVRKQ